MNAYIEKIDRLVSSLNELKPLKQEDQIRLDKKIRLEFNYNSNHLEGNTLTYSETELLLIFGKTSGNHDYREYDEMKAHDVAFNIMKELAADEERPLTEMHLKNLNEIILVRPYWKEAQTAEGQATRRLINVGNYKEFPNSVRLSNGEIFQYALPEQTPILMGELIEWYNLEERKSELHPLELAALLHYRFVRVHPFDDGNGRISRLLMNYVLMKHHLPPVVIRSNDKNNYLFALNQADTGNAEAFSAYIGEQLIWMLELNIKAAKGESIAEDDDWQKNLWLLKNKLAGGTEQVELTKSRETLKILFNNSIIPLAKAWEDKLKLIDPLFLSRSNRLMVGNNGKESPTSLLNLFQLDDEQFYQQLNQTQDKLKLSVSFKGLRNKDNHVSMNGGEIFLEFFKNAYEISYTNADKNINKLYRQILTEKEIQYIVNKLGSWFMKNVEEYLERE